MPVLTPLTDGSICQQPTRVRRLTVSGIQDRGYSEIGLASFFPVPNAVYRHFAGKDEELLCETASARDRPEL